MSKTFDSPPKPWEKARMPLGFLGYFTLSLVLIHALSTRAADKSVQVDHTLGHTLIEFLQNRNASNLVNSLVPSIDDWESEAKRFNRTLQPSQRADLEKDHAGSTRHVERSGEAFLKLGDRFGILSTNATWTIKQALASRLDKTTDPRVHQANESMEYAPNIRLVLIRAEDNPARKELNGEYVVELEFPSRFPDGWRVHNGFRWVQFPDGVADPELQADMAFARKLPRYGGDLTPGDDSALPELGQKVATFLRQKELAYYSDHLAVSIDLALKMAQAREPDRKLPPRDEMEKGFAPFRETLIASARSLLSEAERLGLDFSQAKVTKIVAEDVAPEMTSGIVKGFDADEIFITFTLPGNSPAGETNTPSGEVVLAARSPQRILGAWYLQELRWASFPEGLISKEDAARQEFENYVAKHRALPPGTPAPEIELISVTDQSRVKLSDYRGKVVVLEWWATWCGPCQEPMTKLQNVRETYRQWGDKVQILTLSIDEDLSTTRDHLASKKWTSHPNFWAGGGWQSDPAKAFRVSSIPTLYILTPDGTVTYAGSPSSSWERHVTALLNK